MILYKYINKKWISSLINNGSIHIETLLSLKKIEDSNKEIGDKEEGFLSSSMDGHTINSNDPSTISPQLARVLNSGKLRLQDSVTITGNFNEFTDNCYIFSTSKKLSKEIMKSLGKDSCIEIKDAERFFNKLTECIKKRYQHVNSCNMDKVEYVEKSQHHSLQTSTQPVFTKAQRFSYQEEYRFIWTTDKPNDIVSETFLCPDIKEFISIASI